MTVWYYLSLDVWRERNTLGCGVARSFPAREFSIFLTLKTRRALQSLRMKAGYKTIALRCNVVIQFLFHFHFCLVQIVIIMIEKFPPEHKTCAQILHQRKIHLFENSNLLIYSQIIFWCACDNKLEIKNPVGIYWTVDHVSVNSS